MYWLSHKPLSVFLQEYLARLQAIRQQNYQERKRIQRRLQANRENREDKEGEELSVGSRKPLQPDPEERKRKIAALKVSKKETPF